MMFVGYSEDHAENVFRMFNPETSRIAQSRNVIRLSRMYHTRQDADLMEQLPIVTVPISIHDASVDAEIQKLEVATFPLSKERGVESNSSSDKANEWIMTKTKYGCVGEDEIKLVQTVLTQSYEDEFELGNRCYNTPAQPGMVLMCPVEGKEVLKHEDQTMLRSGVGKLMYQMQYLRPDIAQTVQDLAQYMSCGNLKMLEAMKRCMRYVLCTRDAGILLKPS